MQTSGIWLFAAAAYGTIVMPILLAVMAWRSPPGRRMRRLLWVTGAWLAVCVPAGAAFAMARGRSGTAGGLTVIGGSLRTTLVMLGSTIALGLH